MKLPKKIKNSPWPEEFEEDSRAMFKVSISRHIADHEQLLVVAFMPNRAGYYGQNVQAFRLICSKKQKTFAAQLSDGKSKKQSINDCLKLAYTSARSCYALIGEKDEATIKKWLGASEPSMNHYLPELNAWTESVLEAEKRERKQKRGELLDEDVHLCPEELPEGLEAWVRREIIGKDKVLIYKKGNARGTCYTCGRKVRTTRKDNRFLQDRYARCPDCGDRVLCLLEGGDRFGNHYVQNIVAMQKGTDGKTIFFRQWHVVRDPEARYDNVRDWLREIGRYAARGDKVARWLHEYKANYFCRAERHDLEGWTRFQGTEVYDGLYEFCPASIATAVAGTKLQYADLVGYYVVPRESRYDNHNIIRYAMDWARYPVMEFLWKAGYRKIAIQRVGSLTKRNRDAIRWTQKKLQDCFKFPLRLLKIKASEEWSLDDIQKLNKLWEYHEAGNVSEGDIPWLMQLEVEYEQLEGAMPYASLRKILKYLGAQRDASPRHVGATYRDYIGECIALELDLTSREILFPRDLQAAHNRTMAQVDLQKNKADQEKFAKVVKRLEKFAWERDGLTIRPAREQEELHQEGKTLHHCVGGYIKRMAEGETAIFFLRKAAEPDTPYYTLELRNKAVVQCRTVNNKGYNDDEAVKAFVDAWLEEIVKTNGKSKKKKAKTSAA